MPTLCAFGLTACEVVFPLEEPSVLEDAAPDVPDARPVSCQHEDLLLCLAFEDDPSDGQADDSSGRGLNATTQAVSSTEREPGELALGVDTTSSVVIQGTVSEPGSTALDLPTPVSYDLWLQFESALPDPQVVLDNEFQYGIQIAADDDFPGFPITVGCNWAHPGTPDPADLVFRSINVPTTVHEWHHIACVYDGAVFRLYLDSVVTQQDATGPINAAATNFLNIGRAGTVGKARNVIGQIDNVRIWNRVLSDDEVRLIFMKNEPLVP